MDLMTWMQIIRFLQGNGFKILSEDRNSGTITLIVNEAKRK